MWFGHLLHHGSGQAKAKGKLFVSYSLSSHIKCHIKGKGESSSQESCTEKQAKEEVIHTWIAKLVGLAQGYFICL